VTENVDRRVLAGFQCVDAMTSGSILAPLSVTSTQLVLLRNASGIFAVMDGPGFRALTSQFLAPAPTSWPPPSSFEITIQDPSFRYLARRASIAAPQPLPTAVAPGTTTTAAPTTTALPTTTLAATTTPAATTTVAATTTPAATTTVVATTTPAATTTVASGPPLIPPVTTPQSVVLYPTPAAPVAPNWAVVRVAVVSNATPPVPLPWAVVQVLGAGNPPATGLTTPNGEALLAVPGLGLKLSSSGTGAVTETTTPATVTAWFDPSVLTQPAGWVPNPDDILWNLSNPLWKSASQAVQLGPGQTILVALTISV
jgi:hypothetical protein